MITKQSNVSTEALIVSAFKATAFVTIYETCLSWHLILFMRAGTQNWLPFAYPGFLGLRGISQGLELEQAVAWCPTVNI